MISNKDYSQMSLEELVSEEKKLNAQKITTAVIIGFLVGIAIYSATHKGGILTFILLFFAGFIGTRFSQQLKSIQAEISNKSVNR